MPPTSEPREIKILITGFGPFGVHSANPSELSAQPLDGTILRSPKDLTPTPKSHKIATPKSQYPIHIEFQAIKVAYSTVQAVLPPLHENGAYDAYVHVGVAADYDAVTIEQRARRRSFRKDVPDVEGKLAPRLPGKPVEYGLEGDVDEWKTIVDAEKLQSWLRDSLGFEHIATSTDAGMYLCEFIYATSLSASYKQAEKQGQDTPDVPVLFIHVPNLKSDRNPGPYELRELTNILRGVCWWLGSMRRWQE